MEDRITDAQDQGDAESGASLVEYALLLALIVVVCISAMAFFGGSLNDSIDKSGSSFVAASS
jgi:Flp pilus assembly pilin Flp